MGDLATIIQPSFAAGELSPAVRGRVDLAKYRAGAALMRNWFTQAYGGAATRAGTAIVGRCKQPVGTKPRNIDFDYNSLQTYTLEFGELYMRVIMNGGYVLEPSKVLVDVTVANPGVFHIAAHGFLAGDQIFIAGATGMTAINSTAGFQLLVHTVPDADHVTFTDLDGNVINTTGYPAYNANSGTVARVYTLVTPWHAVDLPLLKYVQDADTMTLCQGPGNYMPYNLTRTQHWAWNLAAITFAASVQAPTSPVATTSGAGTTLDYYYVITAETDDPAEESMPSVSCTCKNNALNQNTGVQNTVSWQSPNNGPAPDRYNVYRSQAVADGSPVPSVFGYIGQTVAPNFIDANFSPDFTSVPPSHQNPFAPGSFSGVLVTNPGTLAYTAPTCVAVDPVGPGAGATFQCYLTETGGDIAAIVPLTDGQGYSPYTGNNATGTYLVIADSGGGTGAGATATPQIGPQAGTYPACSTYFAGRKIYGGVPSFPEAIFTSKAGSFNNMDTRTPSQDDDAITVSLTSRQVNAIKHLISMNALLALTSSGAWMISSTSGIGGVITPSTVMATAQAYNGSSDLPPLPINYDILYVQARGSKVRDLSYNFYVNLYTGNDISVLASHLFYGYTLLEWCYAEEPYYQINIVRSDGVLLAFTYLKEQDVFAWSHFDTLGNSGTDTFQSVCSIVEGAENAVYVIVQRAIPGVNGGNPVYYQERFASRNFYVNGVPNVTNAWCVDSGVRYTGAPISVMTGLDHLNGCKVSCLADGSVQDLSGVVANGSIKLNHVASTVLVGLPYVCQLQTLRMDVGEPSIQGKRKKISRLSLIVQDTRGLKCGPMKENAAGQAIPGPLVEIKERSTEPYGSPVALKTGIESLIINPQWQIEGAVFIQQDYPLPATVLATIPTVVIGDDPG